MILNTDQTYSEKGECVGKYLVIYFRVHCSISLYTFGEYFERYKRDFKIAIRRQWIGQASDSEHGRALGLVKKPGNAPWVYEDIVGKPRSGWRSNFPKEAMRTVYFLMIEK